VRAQLKSLMAKTDTHRQSELVNLLSRILTPIRLASD
jgi:DNA-binding CsgD family transcriptional regulator